MGDYRELDRRLLWGITVAGLLVVLYLRLIPFDISLSGGLSSIFTRFTWQPLSIRDVPGNLLIFVPFSFGLAGLLHQSGRSWSRVTWITVLTVLALSTAIELLQVYIPERVPSLTDIGMNGLSALVGVALYRLSLFGVRRAIVRYASPTTVVAGLTIYAGFIALLTTYLLWSVGLSTWNESYPLTLGNETSDFRPWEGEISQVVLSDRAIDEAESGALLTDSSSVDVIGRYDLTGMAPFTDHQGQLPPLIWQPNPEDAAAPQPAGATVGAAQWLASTGTMALFSGAARSHSEFTLAAAFRSALERQRGPARIVSVSSDSGHRNLTLGQQGDALTIRLRTPSSGYNGEKPEMIIPGFFTPLAERLVVLTYDAPNLSLYVDAPAQRHRVSLAPGLALFQDFAQTNRWLLPFPENPHLWDYRYWSLVTIPALLAAAILIGIRDAAIGRTVVPASIEARD